MNATTNLCSETTKQKSPPAEAGPGTEPKKRARTSISGRGDFVQRSTSKRPPTDYTTTGLRAYSPVVLLSSQVPDAVKPAA